MEDCGRAYFWMKHTSLFLPLFHTIQCDGPFPRSIIPRGLDDTGLSPGIELKQFHIRFEPVSEFVLNVVS